MTLLLPQVTAFVHHSNGLYWLVSYRNENTIVDIAGLSCERARVAIARNEDSWMGEICRENHTAMAVIYTRPYQDIVPEDWVQAARLLLIGPLFMVSDRAVDIYITDPDRSEEVYSALDRWEPMLPAGTELQLIHVEEARNRR